ncbi:NosD domain-containing protein [Pyxidicoccus sp. 3LG]
MSWKKRGSLTLLTLGLAACGAPADTGAPGAENASALEPQDTWPTPTVEVTPPAVEPGLPSPGPAGEPWGPNVPPPEPREPRTLVVPKHYDTIQAAIDAAFPGDTVYVAPGVYSEHVTLRSGIRLLGAGAPITLWDGRGESRNLIDFTGARDVEISGFTFRNVGSDTHCTMTYDLDRWCGGNWYAAAIYADGHDFGTSARVWNNIFQHNGTAVRLYHHALAEVRNNLFLENDYALAFSYFQDASSAEDNIFWNNTWLAIGVQAGYVDLRRNVIAGSYIGLSHEYVQTGDIRCNVFIQNQHHAVETHAVPPRVVMGENGNVVLDPLFEAPEAGDFRLRPDSPLKDVDCSGARLDAVGLTAP